MKKERELTRDEALSGMGLDRTRVMVRLRAGGVKPGELDERTGLIYLEGRRSGGKVGPTRILSIHGFTVAECEAL